jgi:hypothetical protein
MKGEQVRTRLLSSGYVLKNIAAAMNETPQNFDMLLRAKDIKTGTIERICRAINKTIDFFYDTDEYSYLLHSTDEHLDELRHAAFEVLLLHPGSTLDTWKRTLLAEYPSEVQDALGHDPDAALTALWHQPYKDTASNLEYPFSQWAEALATPSSIQMYYALTTPQKK